MLSKHFRLHISACFPVPFSPDEVYRSRWKLVKNFNWCSVPENTNQLQHNSHYADIKLNEHWYSDIAAKELSIQIDENDNCITVTEVAVLYQPLQKENTIKEKLNKENYQQLFTKQIESTHEKTYWHWK